MLLADQHFNTQTITWHGKLTWNIAMKSPRVSRRWISRRRISRWRITRCWIALSLRRWITVGLSVCWLRWISNRRRNWLVNARHLLHGGYCHYWLRPKLAISLVHFNLVLCLQITPVSEYKTLFHFKYLHMFSHLHVFLSLSYLHTSANPTKRKINHKISK